MPNLPTEFHHGGCDWTIVRDSAVLQAQERRGLSRLDKLEVAIDDTLPIVIQRLTLLHELIHVSLRSLAGGDYPEERFALVTEEGLFALLTDNPQLRHFIWPEDVADDAG